MGQPLTREEAATLFQRFLADPPPEVEAWAVSLRESQTYVGHAWLTTADTPGSAEVGFILDPRVWRQGYGTEVAIALLKYALYQKGFSRVFATVDADHVASIKVLERAGMTRERAEQDAEGEYLVYSASGMEKP